MTEIVPISAVLEQADPGCLFFFCPGCQNLHPIYVFPSTHPQQWVWDGNVDAPTFSPSLLVEYNWGAPHVLVRCHSFIRAGKIEFLSDCTHALAGQTVAMVPIPEDR